MGDGRRARVTAAGLGVFVGDRWGGVRGEGWRSELDLRCNGIENQVRRVFNHLGEEYTLSKFVTIFKQLNSL